MDQQSIELAKVFFAVGTIILLARLFGDPLRKVGVSPLVSEILLGIVLGPSVIGHFFPQVTAAIYPAAGGAGDMMRVLIQISIVLLMFAAGLEINLRTVVGNLPAAIKIGALGITIPVLAGFAAAYLVPRLLGENAVHPNKLAFALFFCTALAISALSVTVRTFLDTGLLRTRFGMVVISASMIDDIIGWILFAVTLGLIDGRMQGNVFLNLAGAVVFAIFMLTAVRGAANRIFPLVNRHLVWPASFLGLATGFGLVAAAVTQFLGLEAVFGAFIAGVALGDSPVVTRELKEEFLRFISSIFAPLFFVAIGLKVNFITNFHLPLIALVFALAITSKFIGGSLGGIWAGLPRRQAYATGLSLTARGGQEIVLGTVALGAGLISPPIFVAVVLLAVVTSLLLGPTVQFLHSRWKLSGDLPNKAPY